MSSTSCLSLGRETFGKHVIEDSVLIQMHQTAESAAHLHSVTVLRKRSASRSESRQWFPQHPLAIHFRCPLLNHRRHLNEPSNLHFHIRSHPPPLCLFLQHCAFVLMSYNDVAVHDEYKHAQERGCEDTQWYQPGKWKFCGTDLDVLRVLYMAAEDIALGGRITR
jgi:hypothetical protein